MSFSETYATSEVHPIDIVDDTTMEFRIGAAIDTGFPFVLAGPAGLVLDEEAFFADAVGQSIGVLAAWDTDPTVRSLLSSSDRSAISRTWSRTMCGTSTQVGW